MKRVVFLFAVVSFTSLLGCASNPPPPPIAPTPAETAAMKELNQETSGQNAQPAPQPAQN
jgi:hypothetical protein